MTAKCSQCAGDAGLTHGALVGPGESTTVGDEAEPAVEAMVVMGKEAGARGNRIDGTKTRLAIDASCTKPYVVGTEGKGGAVLHFSNVEASSNEKATD